jgi:hypothetical protein
MCDFCYRDDEMRTKQYVRAYYARFYAAYYGDYYADQYVGAQYGPLKEDGSLKGAEPDPPLPYE